MNGLGALGADGGFAGNLVPRPRLSILTSVLFVGISGDPDDLDIALLAADAGPSSAFGGLRIWQSKYQFKKEKLPSFVGEAFGRKVCLHSPNTFNLY